MKSRRSFVSFLILFFAICPWLEGCRNHQGVDWNERVGHYSYEDMTSDYGEPWTTKSGPDGSKICEWPVFRGQSWNTHARNHHREFQVRGQRDPNSHLDYYYRMTFNAEGVLIKWDTVDP